MLVLTRRSGESIVIGDGIRVRVLGSSATRVRLGIEAPDNVRIVREKAPDDGTPAPVATTDRPTTAIRASHALSDRVASHVAVRRA